MKLINLQDLFIDMSKKVTLADKRKMAQKRALDYSKKEIADDLDVSRKTVDYHLNKMREEVENHETPQMKLAEILFEPDEIVPFVMEEAENPLQHVDFDELSLKFAEWKKIAKGLGIDLK